MTRSETKTSEAQAENSLLKSAQYLKGIGPKRFEALQRLSISTIRDLYFFFPRRYTDRSNLRTIQEANPNTSVTIRGTIDKISLKRPRGRAGIVEMLISDDTDSIHAIWFNQPYLKGQYEEGDEILLSGKVGIYKDRIQMTSPEHEKMTGDDGDTTHAGRIVPIYPLTEGLFQRPLRQAMKELVDSKISDDFSEYLPEDSLERNDLMARREAMIETHFPSSLDELKKARERIIFDEFFAFQLILLKKIRAMRENETSYELTASDDQIQAFYEAITFELTRDQQDVITSITKDVSHKQVMNRLLQGEVGSGKTVVAAFALNLAAQSGVQGALVAPTEILAEQHYKRLTPLFEKLGVKTYLLTGSVEGRARSRIYEDAGEGKPGIYVGTHALLQDDITFGKLGLVVIDEQHRFGVEQRGKLVLRKPRPHMLVMTATPIPRTLALTLFGDLDVSTIKAQPKGRKPVKTYWIAKTKQPEVFTHIRDVILKTKQQAYVLFPIINETEKLDLSAATKEFENLRIGIFKDLNVGLVHGRLDREKRDRVMNDFHERKIDVLVATSLIEVGVDNPNVTFMVIENADRFGLSQLHQMRGRIGRGDQASMCFLFAEPKTEDGKKRLHLLTKISDGFQIAEEDLLLRGPGEFFGTKQSGVPYFNLADLSTDHELLQKAREEAKLILENDPKLSLPKHAHLKAEYEFQKVRFES